MDQVWHLVEPPLVIPGTRGGWFYASWRCDGRAGQEARRLCPGLTAGLTASGYGQLRPGGTGSKQDSGRRHGPRPKSPGQSPKHLPCPSSHLALVLPGPPSAGRDLQPLPCSPGPSCSLLLTLKCSGRGHPSAKQTSGTRICDSVLIIGAIWLLSGSFTRRQGFLGVGLRPAWLLWLCLIALACPGCLLRMWHGECRGAPSDRQPGPPAESPAPQLLSWQAGWGLSGGSQRGCFGTWRTFGRLRARALE